MRSDFTHSGKSVRMLWFAAFKEWFVPRAYSFAKWQIFKEGKLPFALNLPCPFYLVGGLGCWYRVEGWKEGRHRSVVLKDLPLQTSSGKEAEGQVNGRKRKVTSSDGKVWPSSLWHKSQTYVILRIISVGTCTHEKPKLNDQNWEVSLKNSKPCSPPTVIS